jgi:hypothetical protein
MKNKGCVIAGCAGVAIVAVVLSVIGAAGGYYFYQKKQVETKFETYQPPANPEVPNLPPNMPEPPAQPNEPSSKSQDEFKWPITETPLDQKDQFKLVAITLAGFDQGVKSGTLRGFHQAFVANSVKRDLTAQKFDQSFQKFLTMKIDIHPEFFIQNPKFTKAQNVTKDGSQIEFAGNYIASTPHGGLKVSWELKYLYEKDRGWGVTMIGINTLPQ